ncbi:Oligoendopeptidase F, plasmid [Phycisphaerae bacterium RAS1]|nr:Oligoendopeptidase F, plasmid [Phycisphaerae bacterium RAS1]
MQTQPSPREFPRTFVAAEADFGRWSVAENYYRELSERPVASQDQLERWLRDWSELDACFDEEGTGRYIAMTCQTDDAQRQERFRQFIEEVKPHREPWHDRLRRRLAELAGRFELPAKRYEVLLRSVRNAIELYRDENVALQTEDELLQADYQKITGAMTVQYDGREQTIAQIGRYLEEPDRAAREATWRLAGERYLADGAALTELYRKMVGLRDRIATNAHCRDFREYQFKHYERFDYTPDDCLAFHDAIERVVVPAARQLSEQRRKKLGLAALRPWDLSVDPDNLPPLRPFDSEQQLIDNCGSIFRRVHVELGKVFDALRDASSLDLGNRKGKAPGGYQATYHERRLPFIFMNAVGTDDDVRTLLHEGGHAFHTWACRSEPLLAYRHAPIEFSEVASMGMECLALPYMHVFYSDDDRRRATRQFFEKIVRFFPFMARIDAFQHHVYTHIGEGPEEWSGHWQQLTRRFGGDVDWSGLERFDRLSWQRKLHLYEVPFYYVEYGIAQLGALQVWLNSRRDFEQAVSFYRNGLALGGSRPVPELFAAAGCRFDFSEKTLRPLIEAVMQELERLGP